MKHASIYLRQNGAFGAECDGTKDTGYHITEDSGLFTVRSHDGDKIIARDATRMAAETLIAEDWRNQSHSCVEQISWHLNLQHFGDTNIKYLDVKGSCQKCGKAVVFRGPMGVSAVHATVSLDGSVATVPLLLEDEEYDGKAVGYSLSVAHSN